MRRLALIFIVLFFFLAFFLSLSVRAAPRPVPNLENLQGPPSIIKYQGKTHAVFNLGGIYFLYKVTRPAIAYPQCNALQVMDKEIKVVGNNPDGYLYFVEATPVAFKTDHNPQWMDLIKRTFRNGG